MNANGFHIKTVNGVFTATASAYEADDVVGAAATLPKVAGYEEGVALLLSGYTLRDSAGQSKDGRIFLFRSEAPSVTDKAAFAWGSSLPSYVGHFDIAESDYVTIAGGSSVIARSELNLQMKLAVDSTNLYAVFQTLGTPNYGAGATLSVDFHFRF